MTSPLLDVGATRMATQKLPFFQVLEISSWIFLGAALIFTIVGVGLHIEDVQLGKKYDQFTRVVTTSIDEKEILGGNHMFHVSLEGKPHTFDYVDEYYFKRYEQGDPLDVVIPTKDLLTYKNIRRGISIPTSDPTWKAEMDKAYDALSPEEQKFSFEDFDVINIKDVIDAKLSMRSVNSLLVWLAFCLACFLGGYFARKKAPYIKEKFGDMTAYEIGQARRNHNNPQ